VLLLNECLLLFISLLTKSGNFWIQPCIALLVLSSLLRSSLSSSSSRSRDCSSAPCGGSHCLIPIWGGGGGEAVLPIFMHHIMYAYLLTSVLLRAWKKKHKQKMVKSCQQNGKDYKPKQLLDYRPIERRLGRTLKRPLDGYSREAETGHLLA
jgi:hypothetical protein